MFYLEHFTGCFICVQRNLISPVDTIHSQYLKEFRCQHQQFFINLFNCNLLFEVFANLFKHVIIRSLLEHSMNKEEKSSYLAITNLSELSKITKKLLLAQISEHLSTKNLGFNSNRHTVKVTLQKLVFFFARINYSGKHLYGVSLDFSAAFDKIDNSLLLEILEKRLVLLTLSNFIFSTVLYKLWQKFLFQNTQTKTVVPQGSVFGSHSFILHLHPLLEHLIDNTFPYNCYADNLQLFIDINPENNILQTAHS